MTTKEKEMTDAVFIALDKMEEMEALHGKDHPETTKAKNAWLEADKIWKDYLCAQSNPRIVLKEGTYKALMTSTNKALGL